MAGRGGEEGMDTNQATSPGNMHFFRPSDGIYVSEGPESRTICVSSHLPPAMARSGDWRVEDFELHKELYRGKTSLLYMATDRISGIQVALKLYRKRKLSILNRYQVEREVRLHINLHHENIIHLFAAFEDEKHVYMVQEFAVCGDLFEDLKKGGGQMKEKYAVRDVIVPFLSALAYLHSLGIIHRDIKPENILLGANKTIKVADFGLSINIHHERPVTRAGTLDYMAPEVLVCPDKRRPEENKDKVLLGYTAQVDSWAVGILAYELLVGYPPFEQESRAATYEHIMYKEPKFPAWMSEEAKRFICLALCKNATQRPTIADLMQHSWVQPHINRNAASGSVHGPSRLRNSVSMVHDEMRDAAQAATAHAAAAHHGSTSLSAAATGHSSPASAAAASAAVSGSAPAPPAGGYARAMSTASSSAVSVNMMSISSSGAAAAGLAAGSPGGPAVTSPAPQPARLSVVVPQPGQAAMDLGNSPKYAARSPQPPTHGSPAAAALHSSSFRAQALGYGDGAAAARVSQGGTLSANGPAHAGQDPRLHDSVSDPAAGRGVGEHPGAQMERLGSMGVRQGAVLQATASGHLASRLGMSPSRPPPLALQQMEHGGGADGDAVAASTSPYGVDSVPASPSAARGNGGGSGPGSSTRPPLTPPGQPSNPPRHRMATLTAPGHMEGASAAAAARAAAARSPAPPMSPKPSPPELGVASAVSGSSAGGGYHRPASGVLSDDSFLPPARSASINYGSNVLSPLQAAVLGPRPGSRLNSPSHSRRNSMSQPGNDPSLGPGSLGPLAAPGARDRLHSQLSSPLNVLEYGSGAGDSPAYGGYDPHGGAAAAAAAALSAAAGGGAKAGMGSKVFAKLWGKGDGVGSGADSSNMDSGASSPSYRGGANASPMARSAAAARTRMLAPGEELPSGVRPLMRESSMASTPRTGSGGGAELTRESSMTIYHRPGKVPGVGRAAQAAREAAELDPYGPGGQGAQLSGSYGPPSMIKTKSLVASRAINGAGGEEAAAGGQGHGTLARMGSDMVLARTAAGAAANEPKMATQRSFTGANSAFARKLANGAIATKVTEYVKGRMTTDEDMNDL